MKIFFPFGFYFALLFCGINAELGIDIKEKHCKIADQVDWTCLENEGQNKFITIEAYHRGLNKHLNNCLENIPRKTIQTFDLLITLCPNCKHHPEDGPKQIIKRVNKAIQDHDIFTIFLGVHCMNTSHCNCDSKTNCGWEEDSEKGHKSNIIYLSKVINFAWLDQMRIGIFTDKDSWNFLTGNNTMFAEQFNLPLFYKSEDPNPNFEDEDHSFGGWGNSGTGIVFRKQYIRGENVCGLQDINFSYSKSL